MNKLEFIEKIINLPIDETKVNIVEKEYSAKLNDIVKRIVSNNDDLFFEDELEGRIITFDEILTADKEYAVEFKKLGLIPIIDCFDNDFVVYNHKVEVYQMFNIVDESIFRTNKELKLLF